MNNHKESKAVRAVMENYMKGTYEADEALLKSVFHEKAIMNGFLGSQTDGFSRPKRIHCGYDVGALHEVAGRCISGGDRADSH